MLAGGTACTCLIVIRVNAMMLMLPHCTFYSSMVKFRFKVDIIVVVGLLGLAT